MKSSEYSIEHCFSAAECLKKNTNTRSVINPPIIKNESGWRRLIT